MEVSFLGVLAFIIKGVSVAGLADTLLALQAASNPIRKFAEDINYSMKNHREFTEYHELWLQRSKVKVSHDLTGFLDSEEDIEIT